jgi:hypothetical protein
MYPSRGVAALRTSAGMQALAAATVDAIAAAVAVARSKALEIPIRVDTSST